MDSSERRRTAARPPRLILGSVGLVLTLLLLALGWGGEGQGSGGHVGEQGRVHLTRPTALRSGSVRLGPSTGAPSRNPHAEDTPGGAPPDLPAVRVWKRAIDSHLRASVDEVVGRAIADASAVSQGRANGQNVTVSMHVRDLDRATICVERNSEVLMRPASNQKLVTCAASLVLLGPGAQFKTPFEAEGVVRAGRLEGDLVVRADGDPLFVHGSNGSLDAWLDPLADQLKAAGILSVSGALVLDEGTYRAPGPGPAWPAERDYWQEYCALSGGFSANAGCLSASVAPGTVGGSARVEIFPKAHGLKRKVSTQTGNRNGKLDVRVGANAWGVTVSGTVPAAARPTQWRFSHPDPVELFGHAIVGGLEQRGITVRDGHRRERKRAGGYRVASIESPLASGLTPILTDSNNSVADQYFLHLGQHVGGSGDRDGGARAVARALEELGVPARGMVQVDGSGLSRDNRVSAQQLTALLGAVLSLDDGSPELFRDALPLAGERGSLKRRMLGADTLGRVWAKTGFINGTSALSGLLLTVDGRRLAFSIMVEYPTIAGLNNRCWKPMQDRLCALLARGA